MGNLSSGEQYRFLSYNPVETFIPNMRAVGVEVPLEILAGKLTKPNLRDVALTHGLSDVTKHHSKESIAKQLLSHRCSACPKYICVFVCMGSTKSGRMDPSLSSVSIESSSRFQTSKLSTYCINARSRTTNY